jgi:peptidoglycan/xylan/chitin deacetylase (PgdA/CDA1 family)
MIHPTTQFVIGSALVAAAGVASYATFIPGNRIWGPVIRHGSPNDPPRVALTFDDGPTIGGTDRILDLLGELNVKAAFFVIGANAERAPELLRRIDREGHLIGNHTFNHSRWCTTGLTRYWQEQIDKTDAVVQRTIGVRPLLFRPPIGHKTPHTMSAARKHGHSIVMWSVRGWDGIPTTPEKIIARVVPRCRAGTILLLHDGVEPGRTRDPWATIGAIKGLVNSLRNRGLEPVRLDELTGLKPYAPTAEKDLSGRPLAQYAGRGTE